MPRNPSVIGLRLAILRQAFDLIAEGRREVSRRAISNCVPHAPAAIASQVRMTFYSALAIALAGLRLQFRRPGASDRSAVGTERVPKVSGKAETITPDPASCDCGNGHFAGAFPLSFPHSGRIQPATVSRGSSTALMTRILASPCIR